MQTSSVLSQCRRGGLAGSMAAAVWLWPLWSLAQAPEAEPGPQPAPVSRADAAADSADAETEMAVPTHPLEVAEAMGWLFVVPFVLASVIAVWISIERLVVLRRSRVIPKPFVERFLLHLKEGQFTPKEALELCESNGSAVAAVFAHGVRKWGKPSVEVEQAIIDGGERQVAQLRNHLRVLNSVATLCPLIGLLGTVIGMIQSFNVIAQADASTRSEQLAIGIALALLTTAVGLLIAIPALTMYIFLAGRVDARVMEMDELAQKVVHLISAEALEPDAASVSRPRSRRTSAAQSGEASEKKAV